MATLDQIVLTICGAAGIIAAALAWVGRWRSWSLVHQGYFVITVMPPMSGVALGLGLMSALPLLAGFLVAASAFAFFGGAILYGLRPNWCTPRWLREDRRRRGLDR